MCYVVYSVCTGLHTVETVSFKCVRTAPVTIVPIIFWIVNIISWGWWLFIQTAGLHMFRESYQYRSSNLQKDTSNQCQRRKPKETSQTQTLSNKMYNHYTIEVFDHHLLYIKREQSGPCLGYLVPTFLVKTLYSSECQRKKQIF